MKSKPDQESVVTQFLNLLHSSAVSVDSWIGGLCSGDRVMLELERCGAEGAREEIWEDEDLY